MQQNIVNHENKMRVLDAIKEIEHEKQMFNMSEHAGSWFYVIGATLEDIKRFLKKKTFASKPYVKRWRWKK